MDCFALTPPPSKVGRSNPPVSSSRFPVGSVLLVCTYLACFAPTQAVARSPAHRPPLQPFLEGDRLLHGESHQPPPPFPHCCRAQLPSECDDVIRRARVSRSRGLPHPSVSSSRFLVAKGGLSTGPFDLIVCRLKILAPCSEMQTVALM